MWRGQSGFGLPLGRGGYLDWQRYRIGTYSFGQGLLLGPALVHTANRTKKPEFKINGLSFWQQSRHPVRLSVGVHSA